MDLNNPQSIIFIVQVGNVGNKAWPKVIFIIGVKNQTTEPFGQLGHEFECHFDDFHFSFEV